MEKLITAFFMAWGNFLRIPCPVKKWDDSLKKEMLKMLPSVGLVIGLLWFLLGLASYKLRLPYLLSGFLMTAYIYGVTGFFHLDGFMDVRDAVMSRRNIEERQRILKDSHVGAFAVISVVILILGMFAGTSAYMYTLERIAETEASQVSVMPYLAPFILIPICSRQKAGGAVLKYKPMKSSQYADMESLNREREKVILPSSILSIQGAAYLFILLFLTVVFGVFGSWSEGSRALSILPEAMILIVWGITSISTGTAIRRSRKDLGGMNGDIAGYGICMGEIIGVVTMPIIASIWMLLFN